MKFLFWNVGKMPVSHLVAGLAAEHAVDIVILTESLGDTAETLAPLRRLTGRAFEPVPIQSRMQIFSAVPSEHWQFCASAQEGRWACAEVKQNGGESLLLAIVHVPSKMFRRSGDQASHCARLAEWLRQVESDRGHSRTIVAGDFNMNPFESGLVAADCLHAVHNRAIAARAGRTYEGVNYPFLYNPMWPHFAPTDGRLSNGTFYRDRGDRVSLFWNIYDQVLVRPELLNRFDDNDVEVLDHAGTLSLTSGNASDRLVSDHLPILFAVDLERRFDKHVHANL